jgi:probable rRNA maturation factor
LNIRIFYDNIPYRIKSWKKTRSLIEKVIAGEKKTLDDLNFILTNDRSLKQINVKFLNHNYNTDVISFGYGDGNLVSGEVYISLETVRRNSKNYKVSCTVELLRVIIHGTLHLCGYDDQTNEERAVMREREDFWLGYYEKRI